MKPFPPQRTDREPIAFLRSPLNLFLTVAGLVLFSIAVNGYMCYRSDHLSQIPLIFIQHDPGLFPRDWFFQNFGHFKLRFVHLILIKSLAWAVGIPASLFVLYVLCLGLTMGAWLAIARHVYGSTLPGIVSCLMAIVFYGEVGANHLIERILIPRTEAFAVIYWGVFCLISGRMLFAGLLFGAASCIQPAVGIQFAIPLLFWIWFEGEPARLRRSLIFVGAFGLVLVPWLLFLGDSFTGASRLTNAEIITVVAWLRHPPLMLPRFFGRSVWVDFLLLLFTSSWAWWRMGRHNARISQIGWILPILAGLLFVATIFIEFVPVKDVILFQPFRVSVLLYLTMFLMLAPHLLEHLRSDDPFRRFRGVMLLGSLFVLKLLGVLILVEVVLAWRDSRGKATPAWDAALLACLTIVGGFLIEPEVGGGVTTWVMLGIVIAITLLIHGLSARHFFSRPGTIRIALLSGSILGYAFAGSAFAMPWDRWLNSENPNVRVLAAETSWRYEIDPAPIMAIERIGVWAQEHTPKDALFLIPPEKNAEGFRIWSLRSVVFNVKHFPVTQEAYEEWRSRYLAHCGILDPGDPAEAGALEDAMTDYGTKRIREKYAGLTANQFLALASKYEADYGITAARYDDPRLELIYSDFDRTALGREGHELFLYRVVGGTPSEG